MQPRTELASCRLGPVHERPRARGRTRRGVAARVSVAWSPARDIEGARSATELAVELGAEGGYRWSHAPEADGGWLDVLAEAGCTEVTLTARLGDHGAKHAVLELAELLTFKLAATQPLIRVRFLAEAGAGTEPLKLGVHSP